MRILSCENPVVPAVKNLIFHDEFTKTHATSFALADNPPTPGPDTTVWTEPGGNFFSIDSTGTSLIHNSGGNKKIKRDIGATRLTLHLTMTVVTPNTAGILIRTNALDGTQGTIKCAVEPSATPGAGVIKIEDMDAASVLVSGTISISSSTVPLACVVTDDGEEITFSVAGETPIRASTTAGNKNTIIGIFSSTAGSTFDDYKVFL